MGSAGLSSLTARGDTAHCNSWHRDGYLAVGELDAVSGAASADVPYTIRTPPIRTLAQIAEAQSRELTTQQARL